MIISGTPSGGFGFSLAFGQLNLFLNRSILLTHSAKHRFSKKLKGVFMLSIILKSTMLDHVSFEFYDVQKLYMDHVQLGAICAKYFISWTFEPIFHNGYHSSTFTFSDVDAEASEETGAKFNKPSRADIVACWRFTLQVSQISFSCGTQNWETTHHTKLSRWPPNFNISRKFSMSSTFLNS